MTHMNSETRATWQQIADDASPQRPSVGKTVIITKGRKHKGKSGVVVKHAVSLFSDTKYKTPAMLSLMEINGREGYYITVKMENGETFSCSAEYAEVQ